MSDDYGRDWLVGDDLDAACVESIKRRMAAGAVDSRIMVRAGWVDALRQRAEAAERERDAAREQVAALREALESFTEMVAPVEPTEQTRYCGYVWDGSEQMLAAANAALAADATQAGERWRAEREVLESATRWREAMRGLDALARTAVWGEQELAESRRLAAAQSEALLQLTSALDRLAALGEEAGE